MRPGDDLMNHQGKKPFLIIETYCSHFVVFLKKELEAGGFVVFQSFDLQSTRVIHETCSCPRHGSEKCTCELVVFLLYRPIGGPITLILDGCDGFTNIYLNVVSENALRSGSIGAIEKAIWNAASLFPVQATIPAGE